MSLALPRLASPAARRTLGWHGLTALALAVAATWQATTPTNSDVSWLLDCADRVLDGGRFYVDFIEINPPASVLLYLPAAALARWLPFVGGGAVLLLTVLGFALSLALADAILRQAGVIAARQRPALGALSTIAFLALPMSTFGEREHLALLASLPFLACCGARAAGHRPSLPWALAAGVGAGLAIVIKPIFALAFAGPLLLVALRVGWRRSPALPEVWMAAAVAGAYALGVTILLPDFATTILPLAVDVYVPVRRPIATLLASPGLLLWLLLGATLPLAGRRDAPGNLPTILLLASAGFQAASLVQGKGFPYHSFPAIALAVLAAGMALVMDGAEPAGERPKRLRLAALLGLTTIGSAIYFTEVYDPRRWAIGLAEAMTTLAPHPRVMAITAEIALGHPFVGDIGGTWVGREPATWISSYVDELSAGRRHVGRLAPYVAAERRVTAEDITRQRPDEILIDDTGWMAWIAGDPALATAFSAYVKTGTYDTVVLWARRDLVR